MCLFQASGEGLDPSEKSENDESFEPFTYKVTFTTVYFLQNL